MSLCENYNTLDVDIKSLLVGLSIACDLQEYYKDENIGLFFDDYMGYKFYSFLRVPDDRDYYNSLYGASKGDYFEYFPGMFHKYMTEYNSADFNHVGLRQRRNLFANSTLKRYHQYKNCADFIKDVIEKIWTIQIKWKQKTIEFIRTNNIYCIDLTPPETVNKNTAKSLIRNSKLLYNPGEGLTQPDINTLNSLIDYGSRNKKRSSKRRPKRSSKRRPKRSSKRRPKRSSKRR
jgi:hypothetical protein